MDPTACWLELQNLVITAHWQEAKQLARELLEWLKKDGFAPRICGHPTFDRRCAEATCERILTW